MPLQPARPSRRAPRTGRLRIGQGYVWQAEPVIVVTEHRADDGFLDLGRELLTVLAGADGFVGGQVGLSPDDPGVWLMVTTWRDVGSMRRGFGSFDAKVAAAPVMMSAVDRVSAFEVMVEATPDEVSVHPSDRAQG